MRPHTGQQIIIIHILPNTSRSKVNRAKKKIVQLIKYSERNIFLQNSCGKWSRGTSSKPLFVYEKSFK